MYQPTSFMYEAVKSNIPPRRAAGPVASALRARHQAMVTSCTIIIRISKALEKVTSVRSRARSALSTWFCTRKSYHMPRGGGWKPPFHGLRGGGGRGGEAGSLLSIGIPPGIRMSIPPRLRRSANIDRGRFLSHCSYSATRRISCPG